MLNKIQDRPLWYKVWAIIVGIVALYTLIIFVGVLFEESFAHISATDYLLVAFVQFSILLEMYLFPKTENEKANQN
ncbi:hypothetical protein G3569_18035 [Aliifodinibius halophilus]|uniref:Uncharacterized protein n=1 Tax=Fodinibius halophilus TaxID=1736908 RepID=A0A6M1TPY3_9BACT|nr:hypothetical protein [Fodinibius halophilus]